MTRPAAGARYALYYAPPPDSPWWAFGCRWLGRDPAGGESIPPPQVGALPPGRWRALTAQPRTYGFHATLKAPFRLSPGRTELELLEALAAFARGRPPFAIEEVAVRPLAGFLALRPGAPAPPMDALAQACLRGFEPFRAPLAAEEQAARARGLDDRERALLARWGYPYVLERFRFHLTLTGALPPEEREAVRRVLARLVAPVRGVPLPVDAVCLFGQRSRGAPFRLLARARFDGRIRVLGTLEDGN